MTEKHFASLTSGLLARKGQARPAMRPQGFGADQGAPEDLGWNDMGHDVERPAPVRLSRGYPQPGGGFASLTQIASPARQQQEEIAREFEGAPEPHAPEAPAVEEPAAAAPLAELPVVEATEPPAPEAAPQAIRKGRAARRAAPTPTPVSHTGGRKAAFTLRLDTERHLRLRLACAVQNRSAQQLVTEALDQLLAELPDVERLAASLPGADPTDAIPGGTK